MYQTSYHDTTKTTENIDQFEDKAQRQEDRILKYMIQQYPIRYAPHHICRLLFESMEDIGSVRRAMTNLAEAGKLTKTDHMVKGHKGRNVHTWQAIVEMKQAKLF